MANVVNKEEIRAAKRGNCSAAGNAATELEALDKLHAASGSSKNAIITITVGCSTYYSIVCC